MITSDQLLRLEELAFAAWPAEEVERADGWRLRWTRGVTRRANSVWPNEATGDAPLSDRIARAEAFYAAAAPPRRSRSVRRPGPNSSIPPPPCAAPRSHHPCPSNAAPAHRRQF